MDNNKEGINEKRKRYYTETMSDPDRHRAYLETRAKRRNRGTIPDVPPVDIGFDPSSVSDSTLSWLAALIDGEGCFLLTKGSHSPSSQERSPSLRDKPRIRMSINIANTNYKLMEALIEKTGIDCVYTHNRPVGSKQKPLYTWRMNATQIKKWLPFIHPWLVLKREQAEIMMEVVGIREKATPRKGEKWVIPNSKEYQEKLSNAVDRIRILNRRGVQNV